MSAKVFQNQRTKIGENVKENLKKKKKTQKEARRENKGDKEGRFQDRGLRGRDKDQVDG